MKKGTYLENLQFGTIQGKYGPEGNGVALYGGFAGDERVLSNRNPTVNPTVIDGGNKSSVVMILSCTDPRTCVDGFVIQKGTGVAARGGGVYSSDSNLTIANCLIQDNTANAGAGCAFTNCQAIIKNNNFRNNLCWLSSDNISHGVGISSNLSFLTVTDNTFTGNGNLNGAAGIFGMVLEIQGGWGPKITRNKIVGNSGDGGILLNQNQGPFVEDNLIAENRGHGIVNGGFSSGHISMIRNNTIVSNSGRGLSFPYLSSIHFVANNIIASNAVGIALSAGTLTLSHNNFYANSTSFLGASRGPSDISSNPQFKDAHIGDYRLLAGSPCIDTGDNAYAATPTDLGGTPRILNALGGSLPVVDMGCYESPDLVAPIVTISIPTSLPTFTTNQISLVVGGTATDNEGISSVTWVNSKGGSGVATLAGKDFTATVPLTLGVNLVTVTASDQAGNLSTGAISITRTKK